MEIVVIIGGLVVGVSVLAALAATSFLVAAYFGAPFVATDRMNVMRMLALAEVRPGERMADIGSGDGRLLIAFARAGIESHGYEINPLLVWWSRLRISRAGFSGMASAHRADYRDEDLSGFDVVTVFGIDYMMPMLAEKLSRELRPGARVISNAFSMPGWTLIGRRGQVKLYGVPERAG